MANWTNRRVGCTFLGGIDPSKCRTDQANNTHNVQYSTFAVDAPARSQLAVATSVLAGYRTEPQDEWSAAPKPGSAGGKLPPLLAAIQHEAALSLVALRLQIPTPSSAAHYAMLRYDALKTGRAALAVINLEPHASVAELDLRTLPPQLMGQHPTDPVHPSLQLPAISERYSVNASAHGFMVLSGLQLPQWASQGYLYNCTTEYAPPPVGEMPFAKCLVACLGDSKCDAVTVDWVQRAAWPPPAQMSWYTNQVLCHLRGGIDFGSCKEDSAQAHSTIKMVKQ